jgi:hypothetical protein
MTYFSPAGHFQVIHNTCKVLGRILAIQSSTKRNKISFLYKGKIKYKSSCYWYKFWNCRYSRCFEILSFITLRLHYVKHSAKNSLELAKELQDRWNTYNFKIYINNIDAYILFVLYVKVRSHFFLQNFRLLLSSQVFCIYYVLPEGGNLSQNMS